VCPGRSEVIALPPEFIMPQDGHAKQDCERVAGKRWIAKHAKHVAPYGVTLLGDDLYSNQPLCKLALENGFNFIFVCKPDSHATLYERLAFWQVHDGIKTLESRRWTGRFTEVTVVSLDSVDEHEQARNEDARYTLLMHDTRSASGGSHGVHYMLLS
jgi:hypothetical protein